MSNEYEGSAARGSVILGILGIGFWILVFACCGGLVYQDSGRADKEYLAEWKFCEDTDFKVEIINVGQSFGHKGQLVGNSVMVETKTGQRRMIITQCCPKVGEIWAIFVHRGAPMGKPTAELVGRLK